MWPLDTTGSFASTEEGRAFLQQRTASFGLLLGGLSAGFWIFRVVSSVLGRNAELLRESHVWSHALAALALFALWAVNVRGVRSARFVQLSELVAMTVACLGYGVMGAAIVELARPDFTLLLVFGTLLIARAIYIPTTWRRTVVYAAMIGAVLLVSIYAVFRELDPTTARWVAAVTSGVESERVLLTVLVHAAAWWIVIGTLAASASAVIYGLRREIGKVRQLGQYTLVRKIGEGGMGMVFEAKHAMLRRRTAVKLLSPDRVGEESLARFEREVCATACLTHPNTITVFDHGRTPDGLLYYAMEFIEGGSLAEAVALDGPMPAARAIALVHQMAGALAEAHERGLIHRDIKPDNVMICDRGGIPDLVKVVDFGLVKQLAPESDAAVTSEGSLLGTPLYMAPEAIRGHALEDGRSDLYSVGAVLYFLLTGEHVFTGSTIVEVFSQHLLAAPVSPSERLGAPLPADVEALVLRCLAKEADERPKTASALQDELEQLACWGTWTREDARRWWRDFGPELRARREVAASSDTRTLAVDLGRRAG
jgi:serine/threonine-protein kinase